jgi:hypothetical protein
MTNRHRQQFGWLYAIWLRNIREKIQEDFDISENSTRHETFSQSLGIVHSEKFAKTITVV